MTNGVLRLPLHCQSAFQRHCLQSPVQCGRRYTDLPRPLRNREIFPAKAQTVISSFVRALHLWFSPTTVARLIVAVIVDAIHGVSRRWRQTNIANEVFELSPSIANRYTSTTIVVEFGIFRIAASADDALPYSVDTVAREPVGNHVCANPIRMGASAASRSSRTKAISKHGNLVAAFANAIPAWLERCLIRSTDDGKPAKNRAAKINKLGHWPILSQHKVVCHG